MTDEPYRDDMSPPARSERELRIADHEDWPDGPFTLHYFRYCAQYADEYDTPLEALRSACVMEDEGYGSTDKITDRHGNVVYDLNGYPPTRVAEGYPKVHDGG